MRRGYDPEDLSQIGSIGLMKAIDKFETAFDVEILHQCGAHGLPGRSSGFWRDDGMIKVSRSLKELAARGGPSGRR